MGLTPRKTLRPGRTLLVAYPAIVVVVVVVVAVLLGYQVATDPSPYGRVLDELRFPDAWVVPHADVEQRALFLNGGSRMTRFYLVDADPAETASVVEQVVTAAGFTLDRSWGSTCYRNPSDGPIESCTVAAIRDRFHLWIVMYARGKPVSYSFQGGEPTAGAPNLSVVRVQAGAGY
jgi:hypothetical protein